MSGSPGAPEPVIGLEVHVQLRTRTKLFCRDPAEYGGEPNSRVCPVCLGLPGALPVLNGRAVELAVVAALGLGCRVSPRSAFARKHYFYPDLPRGYQITQHQWPLATGGAVELSDGRPVRIRRLHLEEDTGKSLHGLFPGASALDLNRAGIPLIEIVTEPDLRSPGEAREFLVRLKQILEYLEVSECNMEEGSLRVDANVSLRGGERTEVKNLNSFRHVERALRFEARRQEARGKEGRGVRPETRLWDARRGETRPLRAKEELHDYRYLPEPDLPPLELEEAWVAGLGEQLPEMPWIRQARLQRELELPPHHAAALVSTRALADFHEETVAAGADAREAAAWLLREVLAAAKAEPEGLRGIRLTPRSLAGLLRLVATRELSAPHARLVFAGMLASGRTADEVITEQKLTPPEGSTLLQKWVAEVLVAHSGEVERLRAGEARLLHFLVGQVMRKSGGRADPLLAREALRKTLQEMGGRG